MEPKLFTLSNGLRVVFVDTQAFPTLTTLLLIGAGSRYETKENNGIAHFFEHMPFKGSEKYPSSFAISSTIEGLGGAFNAFTAKDHTGYWVKATSDHFTTVIDLLSDILLRPLLVPEEIEREKGVIVEEINMYEDSPAERVGEIFETLLYQDHPLGYDILGTKETINSFKKETFTNYMKRFYHPSNVVLVVAGGLGDNSIGISDEDIKKLYLNTIEEKFGRWNHNKDEVFVPIKETQTKPELIVRFKKTEQAHYCLGFRAFSFYDKKKYALSVLAAILGGGMSSRLFIEVRERRGLCYYISTGRQLYHDVGNIVTQAGVVNDIGKIKESIELTLKEHKKIKDGEVTEEELVKAKALIKGRLLLSLEKSENVASFFGNELILRKELEQIDDVVASIDKVTRADITALASEIFTNENLDFSIIGPFEKEDEFKSVLRI
jgi:predicted Zn-dependent peptidase